MTCKCGSDKIIHISGKTDDTCSVSFKDVEGEGYVPSDLGIGGGDYIDFSFCGNCGLIQGFQPMSEDDIIRAIDEEAEGRDWDDGDYDNEDY